MLSGWRVQGHLTQEQAHLHVESDRHPTARPISRLSPSPDINKVYIVHCIMNAPCAPLTLPPYAYAMNVACT